MPINLCHQNDREKVQLLAMELSSMAAQVLGMSETEIGHLCPILDREYKEYLTRWLEKHCTNE